MSERLRAFARDAGTICTAVVRAGFSKQALVIAVEVEKRTLTIQAVCPPDLVDAAIEEAKDRARTRLDMTTVQAYESVVADLARGWLPVVSPGEQP